MSENLFNGSATAGSPDIGSAPSANNLGQAQGVVSGAQQVVIDPEQHKELESLVGRQGQELGEYRKFISDITPLLEKLDKNPEIAQAILDEKITSDLAKAALEGKITIGDAQIVTKAHEEVKKDLGTTAYKGATAEEISKLVEERTKEIREELKKELKERDDMSTFEANVSDFIARTPDFAEYASAIDKWIDEHDVTDIAVAYYAVKGEMSVKEAAKKAEADKAEFEKNGALNMVGGSSHPTHIQGTDSKIVDSLIAGRSNPNVF